MAYIVSSLQYLNAKSLQIKHFLSQALQGRHNTTHDDNQEKHKCIIV
jgi:hypothetical protein